MLPPHPSLLMLSRIKQPGDTLSKMLLIDSIRPAGEPGVGRVCEFPPLRLPPSATPWISGALQLCRKCRTPALYTYRPPPPYCGNSWPLGPRWRPSIPECTASFPAMCAGWRKGDWQNTWHSGCLRPPGRAFAAGVKHLPFSSSRAGSVRSRQRAHEAGSQ